MIVVIFLPLHSTTANKGMPPVPHQLINFFQIGMSVSLKRKNHIIFNPVRFGAVIYIFHPLVSSMVADIEPFELKTQCLHLVRLKMGHANRGGIEYVGKEVTASIVPPQKLNKMKTELHPKTNLNEGGLSVGQAFMIAIFIATALGFIVFLAE